MLKPQNNECRFAHKLDGLWRFLADPDDRGETRGWPKGLPKQHGYMAVPSSYNELTQDAALRDYIGPVWYETDIVLHPAWQGRTATIRFGAVSHHAKVWWNGRPVGEHKGGFLPFDIELGEVGPDATTGRLIVRVDNRLAWDSLPPGMVVDHGDFPLSGKRKRQDYFHDFYNYAGIHRSVYLTLLPRRHLTAIRVTPWVTGTKGGFLYEVDGTVKARAEVRLLDASGRCVAEATGSKGRLAVHRPRLWQPGKPYLYTLEVSLPGAEPDLYRLQSGIRTVTTGKGTLKINGKPFYFRGFGKHEDSDFLGKGHSDAVMLKDFALLEWIGANSFRTSHYPYAEEILDHADRTGVVVIGELPAVGFNFMPGHFPVFQPGQIDAATRKHHQETLREMIARDMHHPSVVIWSLANEAATQEKPSRRYFTPIVKQARKLDASRPLMLVMSAFAKADTVGDLFDILGINRYYGWYHDVGDIASIEPNLTAELRAWYRRYRKPIVMTEYGADTVAGFHSEPPVMFSEEFQRDYLAAHHRTFDKLPFLCGEHIWNFADFATKQGLKRIGGNKKGVFTRQRQPKLAAHDVQQRWHKCDASGRPRRQ